MWGFDENAVKVLENMKPADESLIYKYAILLGDKAFKKVTNDNEVQSHFSIAFCTVTISVAYKLLALLFDMTIVSRGR